MMLATLLFTNCKKYNDAEIRSDINELKVRVERLEKLCSEMNTNISSLQAIVVALQNRDAVVSVTDLPDNKGYTILLRQEKAFLFTMVRMEVMEKTELMAKMALTGIRRQSALNRVLTARTIGL